MANKPPFISFHTFLQTDFETAFGILNMIHSPRPTSSVTQILSPSDPSVAEAAAENRHLLADGFRLHDGRYEVQKMLGHGGFSITYLAQDHLQNRVVAVKEFFPPGCVRHEDGRLQPLSALPAQHRRALDTITREAHTLQQFRHSAIVPVLEVWQENNTAYLSMEWIEGRNLKELLDTHRGPLDQNQALPIIRQIGDALRDIHNAQILHYDLKPENILVRPNGEAVLIDFGLAQSFDDDKEQAALVTHTSALVATPGYAALEQYSHHAQRGPYTDVYGLASTLFHALSGQAPPSSADRAAGVPLPSLHDLNAAISPPLAAAIQAAMALAPSDRPQNVEQWFEQLNVATQEHTLNPPAEIPARAAAEKVVVERAAERSSHTPKVPQGVAEHSSRTPEVARGSEGHSKRWPFPIAALLMLLLLWKLGTRESPRVPEQPTPRVEQPAPESGNERPLVPSGETREAESAVFKQTIQADLTISLPMHPEPQFSRDGKTLLSGQELTASLFLWDSQTGRKTTLIKRRDADGFSDFGVEGLCLSPDGRYVAAVVDDRRDAYKPTISRLELWDTRRRQRLCNLVIGDDDTGRMAFSPDNRWLALARGGSGGKGDRVELRDVRSGAVGRIFNALPAESGASSFNETPSVAFSPDAKLLAQGYHDGVVKLWNVNSGALLQQIKLFSSPIHELTFSPDGQLLATHGREVNTSDNKNTDVKVLDLKRNQILSILPSATTPLVFSPDSRRICTGFLQSRDIEGGVRVWDAHSGTPLYRLVDTGGTMGTDTLAFSPNGRTLYGTDFEGPIYIWQLPQ